MRALRLCALALAAAIAALALVAVGPASAAPKTTWLCKPGLKGNPCDSSLRTTVLGPGGTSKVVTAKRAKKPTLDCFYVYPTVSSQTTTNATLAKDPEILEIARQQASRFSQSCRVFAPVYHQVTIVGIQNPDTPASAFEIAYRDVKAAWKEYLAKYNHGRGVILIGHSQGGGLLTELAAKEIDPRPQMRRKLAAAYLLGANVLVPKGKEVGGSFKHLRPCTLKGQLHCYVAYSTFAEEPPADALFGRVGGAFADVDPKKFDVVCNDPTRLAGDKGAMLPYVRTAPFPGILGVVTPPAPDVPTPWAAEPKLFKAHCAHKDGATWLQATDIGGPNDDRTRFPATLGATWGLHLGDVNLFLGNLVHLAQVQSKSWRFEQVAE